ncbi:MAG: hypothetical protein DRP83_05750 [Planctomycetota bacterium]|nr:MAG: hypothetical protein DRP83_05750 [Planctomycetota bacterium]
MANMDTGPIYERLKLDIIERIRSKSLRPGEKLPSLRKMARDRGVSMAPVLQAMQELDAEGYIVRYQGKGVFVTPNNKHPQNGLREIALVVPGIDTNEMFSRMARSMQACCKDDGYREVVLSTEDYKNVAELIEKLPELGPAGAIIFPPAGRQTAEALLQLRAKGFPFALVNPSHLSLSLPCVTGNDFLVGYLATKHLADLGHSRIALVGLGRSNEPAVDSAHYRGYVKALKESGATADDAIVIPQDTIIHRPGRLIEWGLATGEKLFGQNSNITALIAPPAIEAGVVRFAVSRGMKIPHDISVVCVGTALNYLISNKTTAVDFHEDKIIEKALELVVREIETGLQDPVHLQLSCDLVPGETTAPPAK